MIWLIAQAEQFDWHHLWRVLTLEDHNTLVPVIGSTLLGIAAGVIGTFAYLRRRAMMGDALSHATLPGIGLAFILTQSRQLGILILGAAISGILGVLAVVAIRKTRRLKEDAAIGIVLSVFFGFGMVLFSIIQQMDTGQEAGLTSFIYGKAASMITSDALLIGSAALVVLFSAVLLFKEFRIICFDAEYAASQGWPVTAIDLMMMGMVVLVTVVGLQAVGLILVVALLIIPPAAARFWTDSLVKMNLVAATIGLLSGWIGATTSALFRNIPTGAVIVVTAGILFLLSMLLAPHRGLLSRVLHGWALRRKTADQNLLRSLAELLEANQGEAAWVSMEQLATMRAWFPGRLRSTVRRAVRKKIVQRNPRKEIRLTPYGEEEARRVLRNHRLWEMYLIRYADVAPSHVDRDADEVEHVLSAEVIAELERAIATDRIPESPHLQEVPL